MSIRAEMIRRAALSKGILGESAHLVVNFTKGFQNPDGGFKGRSPQSDLYYTIFGINILQALDAEISSETATNYVNYVKSFGDGDGLDLVHLCALAQGYSTISKFNEQYLSNDIAINLKKRLIAKIERYRSDDGGFHIATGNRYSSAYGCFIALLAYQELGIEIPDKNKIIYALNALVAADGGYSNERSQVQGNTLATSAAVTVLHQLYYPISDKTKLWLLNRLHPRGGFVAFPSAPIPDLLSTATALFALHSIGCDLAHIKEQCLDFIDSLWCSDGGFYGSWVDDAIDVEYTFYGLLAIGCLAHP